MNIIIYDLFYKGVGSKCLRQALAEKADKQKLATVLSTQDEKNVVFYTRL